MSVLFWSLSKVIWITNTLMPYLKYYRPENIQVLLQYHDGEMKLQKQQTEALWYYNWHFKLSVLILHDPRLILTAKNLKTMFTK